MLSKTIKEIREDAIVEPERKTPIVKKVDVAVVGGGPAGSVAALAAARNGARVCLIEGYGFLGGMATSGLVLVWFGWCPPNVQRDVDGIYKEIVDRLLKYEGVLAPSKESLVRVADPEVLKYVLDEMMAQAGVELLLHTFAVDALVHENVIKGVIVENKSGRQAILAKLVVDATGDGDVAAAAGATFEKGRKKDGLAMEVTLAFRMCNVNSGKFVQYVKQHTHELHPSYPPDKEVRIEDRFFFVWGLYDLVRCAKRNGLKLPTDAIVVVSTPIEGVVEVGQTKVFRIDGTSAKDLTRAEVEARKQVMTFEKFLKNYVPGFESASLIATAPHIGVRESRRILGEYVLTQEDVLQGRKFDDIVVRLFSGILDVHPSYEGDEFIMIPVENVPYEIPYRCLVPKQIDGLLVAGRCISATHEALGAIRSQQICMAMGQAAGTAAALAVREGVTPRKIDVHELQKLLKQQGLYYGN